MKPAYRDFFHRLRRGFATKIIGMVATAAVTVPAWAAQSPAWEILGPATAAHAAVRVLDTERMPIRKGVGAGLPADWGAKVLFKGPKNGTLEIVYIPPGAEGASLHYHETHEWVYLLEGDYTNNESTTPENYSILQRFREGYFLSRPPYSLHGGEKARMKWMASQVGAILLNMDESENGAGTYSVDPISKTNPSAASDMTYDPNFARIRDWQSPRIIDTIDRMPWQAVEGSPGLNAKYLVDEPIHGFRATMYFLEGRAPTPARFKPHFYSSALQFNFMLAGDLAIDAYGAAGQAPRRIELSRYAYIERAPTSIFGLAPTGATQSGAVWLEVTYAKGNQWLKESAGIEAASYLP